MAREYNYIYSKLVQDDTDIVGHIAYGLYKAKKIEYIKQFVIEHNKEPDEEDLAPVRRMSQANIEEYRFLASTILKTFLENTLNETVEQIEDTIRANHLRLVEDVISPMKQQSIWKTYFHGVMQSMLGALMLGVAIAAFAFCIGLTKRTHVFTVGGDGSIKVEQEDKNK